MARKLDFAAVSRTHDMHRLALLFYARVQGHFFKSVLSHEMLSSEGSRLDSPNQNSHPRMPAHHEDPSKTANRSCKEKQDKCLQQCFKRIMWLEKTLILPSSFEKFIVWEIAARKLDFNRVGIESPAASEQQRHRSDCDEVKTSVFIC